MRYLPILLVLAACHRPAVEPDPPPMVGDAGPNCALACAQLRALGCPEGSGSTSDSCEHRCLVAQELRGLPTECWAHASDVAAARACGQLRCRP